jgi:hypothetical protein
MHPHCVMRAISTQHAGIRGALPAHGHGADVDSYQLQSGTALLNRKIYARNSLYSCHSAGHVSFSPSL